MGLREDNLFYNQSGMDEKRRIDEKRAQFLREIGNELSKGYSSMPNQVVVKNAYRNYLAKNDPIGLAIMDEQARQKRLANMDEEEKRLSLQTARLKVAQMRNPPR